MTTNRSSMRAFQRWACAFGVCALVLSFSGIVSGCGPEAQTPVKVENTGTAPVGADPAEYKAKMQQIQGDQNKGGK